MASNDEPSAFTAITRVIRTKAPAVFALDHVVQLLDALLDVTVVVSLPEAAASGHVRFFDRVYQRIVATQPPIDEFLQEHQLCKSIEAAMKRGHVAMVQRIHCLYPERLPMRLLEKAAVNGHLPMLKWLLAHRTDEFCTSRIDGIDQHTSSPIARMSCCLHAAYILAIDGNHLHIVKWLLESGFTPSAEIAMYGVQMIGDAAAAAGDLDFVQRLHTQHVPNSFSKRAIDGAAHGGHLEVVRYLLANRSDGFTGLAVNHALLGDHHEIYKLLGFSKMLSPKEFRDLGKWVHHPAAAGRLDLVQSRRYATTNADDAMCKALQQGHLDVVQWLWQHHHRRVRLDPWEAAQNGHLYILQWIHHQIPPGRLVPWYAQAMKYAARTGHLSTVQRLHANRPDGGTTAAMGAAAACGHRHVLQWLHENGERCTNRAMDFAAGSGHLAIVQWLHENRTEGCTVDAMDRAARANHQQVVEWLHYN